ncbi:uncharacterized protein BXIN_0222 [Babesia sp. Xinjiang]|uniref:uncharacterized protein n=1 Tax=Babesia sp. Xinjiang TaxID=462227 RepID=UPI000A22B5E4|nr:uncharacterized protein BXIN_0222 [Babesia sp. Xinjiang]ORM39867.1 hypothetical protein BXIN_0222 [Babesia sp. Xinjiang]
MHYDYHVDGIKGLAESVLALLQDIELEGDTDLDLFNKFKDALKKDVIQNPSYGLIGLLSDNLKTCIGYAGGELMGSGIGYKLVNGSVSASAPNKTIYASAYNQTTATWESVKSSNVNMVTCAHIFLGCIPLIFSGLTYLYWQLNAGTGGSSPAVKDARWSNYSLDDVNEELGRYMESVGYETKELSTMTAETVTKVMQSIRSNNVALTYSEYVSGLLTTDITLVRAYLGASCYFKDIRKRENFKHMNHPTSVRDMLFWFTALPQASVYSRLNPENLLNLTGKKDIKFIKGPNVGDILTVNVDLVPSYIFTSCLNAGLLLLRIQGQLRGNREQSKTSVPYAAFLHQVYSNNYLKLYYPYNISELFGVLWEMVTILFFQLKFLKIQCTTCNSVACGWRWCNYGKGIQDGEINSWICEDSTQQHDDKCESCMKHSQECGQNSKNGKKHSPLHAYLTDNLKCFKCENSETSLPYYLHSQHISSSQRCHIPMGFLETHFKTSRNGENLRGILKGAVDESIGHNSIYNIIISLLCFKLPTPLTAGDLFGFFLRLSENMKCSVTIVGRKGTSVIDKETSVEGELISLIEDAPGNYDGSFLTLAAEKLSGTKHTSYGATHLSCSANLHSLYDSEMPRGGGICGKYLSPVALGIYNILRLEFAEVYLSWLIYLTDEFQNYLEALVKAFKGIDCKKSGCMSCNGTSACQKGKHATDRCNCPNIVECAGVLPLMHKFGFTYNSAETLKGSAATKGVQGPVSNNSRSCSDFCQQLTNVKDGPLNELIIAIDHFLYSIREGCLIYLTCFWFLGVLYLTYGLTIPLDVLRLKSHLRFSYTHKILPFALLAWKAVSPSSTHYFKP